MTHPRARTLSATLTLRRAAAAAVTAALVLAAALALLGALAGCGEKIAVPEPTGLFSTDRYQLWDEYPADDPRQLITVQGNLFVLTADSLTKRSQNFGVIAGVGGLADPRALCSDDADSLVFVWDQDLGRVTWYRTSTLTPPENLPSQADLPAVQRCVAMATSRAGIEQVPGAATFLYLADPDSGVVHRYAYEPFTGLIAHGILCRSDGDGARFVHHPAGLARDAQDSLLVCDVDTLRNWVIRFDSVPDLTDTDPQGEDELRGHAALFDQATCVPPAAADYVLGDAAACDEDDWQGGPSDAVGEFTRPTAVTIDGSGRIFVADAGNHRIQVFTPRGRHELLFGDAGEIGEPLSVATVDVRTGGGAGDINFAAYVFVVAGGQVSKYISADQYADIGAPPPPEELVP